MSNTTLNVSEDLARARIIEPQGDGLGKMYINSVAVTTKGTWLVSFTRGDNVGDAFVPERIFLRRSEDRGLTWQPRQLVYDGKYLGARQAEMGQLLVVPDTNRVYQFSINHSGVRFGEAVFTYSDDDGRTWLGPEGPGSVYHVKVPPYELAPAGRSNHFMAKGIVMSNGEFILPMAVATDPEEMGEIQADAVFMISDNILTEGDPERLHFDFCPRGPRGIVVPKREGSSESLAQEPHVVQLSDERLFCTMRTGLGCIYFSTSSDFGRTWAPARPLRHENGRPILHPNAPCPLIKLSNGNYLLFHHNNKGDVFGSQSVYDFQKNRRPVYVCRAREDLSNPEQPLLFSDSKFLCDSDGVASKGQMKTTEMSCYAGIIEDERGVFYIGSNKWARIEVRRIPDELVSE